MWKAKLINKTKKDRRRGDTEFKLTLTLAYTEAEKARAVEKRCEKRRTVQENDETREEEKRRIVVKGEKRRDEELNTRKEGRYKKRN